MALELASVEDLLAFFLSPGAQGKGPAIRRTVPEAPQSSRR